MQNAYRTVQRYTSCTFIYQCTIVDVNSWILCGNVRKWRQLACCLVGETCKNPAPHRGRQACTGATSKCICVAVQTLPHLCTAVAFLAIMSTHTHTYTPQTHKHTYTHTHTHTHTQALCFARRSHWGGSKKPHTAEMFISLGCCYFGELKIVSPTQLFANQESFMP